LLLSLILISYIYLVLVATPILIIDNINISIKRFTHKCISIKWNEIKKVNIEKSFIFKQIIICCYENDDYKEANQILHDYEKNKDKKLISELSNYQNKVKIIRIEYNVKNINEIKKNYHKVIT